ncbi:hypothetical protein SDJN02_12776, partial [Cucurbita argyrosperma subsp. argyrosperma]
MRFTVIITLKYYYSLRNEKSVGCDLCKGDGRLRFGTNKTGEFEMPRVKNSKDKNRFSRENYNSSNGRRCSLQNDVQLERICKFKSEYGAPNFGDQSRILATLEMAI